MKKVAFFVEGPTEADFITALLKELVKRRGISLKHYEFSGGGDDNPRVSTLTFQEDTNPSVEYLVHIYISSGDNRVNSDVLEVLPNLQRLGFSAIIVLKDLRGDHIDGTPKKEEELPYFEAGDRFAFTGTPIPIASVIAVMEIETWFLGETNHYVRYCSKLTPELIKESKHITGVDPFNDRLEGIEMPAETLDRIYYLVKRHYSKKERVRKKTINALDWTNLYMVLPKRIVKLNELVTAVDNFF